MSPKLRIAMENLLIADRKFERVMDPLEYEDELQSLFEQIGEVRAVYEKELGPIMNAAGLG